ncbi:MAG: type I DNA topoisomerase, partial [Firmicutes bacterium]|nr:type I DNA topoisomerase [Bacillota bacterium]
MNLVIVESPAKARTLGKYLGSNYIVDSCMGHIMGVSERRSGGYKWGINIKGDYDIDYVVDEAKQQTVDRLKSKAKKATKIYLATDPDREGEAISWHLSMLLDIEPTDDCRIIFNEISKKAVLYALENPAPINMNLVNSQQARAVMDKLVGYELSPVLWSKVASKLSAGRVQSVALKLIVEREREIQGFIPVEYWTLSAILNRVAGTKEETIKFSAYLHSKLNTSGKAEKIKPANKGEMDAVLADLKSAEYAVTNVKKSVTTSNPPPPFITSTLQQDASNKLGFAASRTMRAAQSLYEGVELEGTPQALITYMRTDSVRVSPDSQREALDYIKTRYGAEYAPPTPNFYKGKKNTQDAHEAIRPITVNINPQAIKGKVSADLYKLYKLIYERFLASQMTPAKYDSVSVDIN